MARLQTLTAVVLAVCVASVTAQQESVPAVPIVVMSGEGIVTAVPDRAYVVLMTETRAPAPREAQKQNAAAMTAVQDRLRAARVPKDAIRTTMFNLQQEFDYRDGRQTPRGFVARHAIEVRLDDLDRVGEIVDAGVASGATSVGNIRFDLKERGKAEREALRLAVADARARAEAAAAGAGRTIDRVLKIEEAREMSRPGPMPMIGQRAMADQATPIAEGELVIRAHVTLTASIR